MPATDFFSGTPASSKARTPEQTDAIEVEPLDSMTSEETRTALLLVTHSAEAAAICHRVLHLRDGAVVAEDARA